MLFEKTVWKERLEERLLVKFGTTLEEASSFEIYQALGDTIMEKIAKDWYDTKKKYEREKQAFYLSSEFLMGRAMGNNLINLGIQEEVIALLKELGIDYNQVEEEEEDAALGNGGLGRLAACFMDSLATLSLPGQGYSIRYKNGIFNQYLRDGYQVEKPETWLRYGDVWSVARPEDEVIVNFGNTSVRALPYDMPIIGYGTKNINTLRLWEAHAIQDLDLGIFNQQDYLHATQEKTLAEDISRVLYPNDSTDEGKKLRLRQQYFFVSASLQDIMKKFKKIHGREFEKIPEYIAIQLNDTHPVIAIPELMRLLVDIEGVKWEEAWEIVKKTFSYTNHTILAEALEKWWIGLYQEVVPRIFQITEGIHNQFRAELSQLYPNDMGKQNRMSIIQGNMIHMAWLAIYGSHKVNGVAELHTEILKGRELRDWYELYPDKFLNKTNGITQRRWLLKSNPQLASYITELIGDAWITDLSELKKLEEYLEDDSVLEKILAIKQEKKEELVKYLRETQGIDINPQSIFDVQVKRMHEYKRQLLNILQVYDLYYYLKENPNVDFTPTTYIYGAKAAPGYKVAKGIIRLINDVAQIINGDTEVNDRLKVVFVENYRVSVAEKLFPAADISEQISTAGKEASGTGNMKFMLNGALTIGTLDGANVEIVKEAGEENEYIFGMRVEDIDSLQKRGYDPRMPYNNITGLKRVVDALIDGHLNDLGSGIYREIHSLLMERGDQYYVLEDFEDYRKKQRKINRDYQDRRAWAKKMLKNIANAGKFSSDRTIMEYAKEIWGIHEVR
ncbi:glycogen/starch/alpha-glucan phosphorylase [Fusobacterium necrophorum]|uniref:Alpha-1,4 glucan phosphorylase n=1 Tax=Fusobacterium necrophorum BL TaxID=1441732 RepID=A0AB73BWL3_9FUSO|nr:glycogen/starch/alpha-glucan phosphorylase [Fusobacterium necrophorum]AYZ74254.1 glycogen/starch/alpha-glucan phosphorylase [Fusobacterium necrophorum]AZW09864.1 glycogen/starch/alpha-glucan phosphorylase [Fusobacterium necrophorum subsp. necrophorum]KDE63474.1 glycosyl transferase family 35 [Fusobacterium necrophorum BL]SDB02954.1 starch phosphorylase [Fusobacterium necrophorum]SQD08594.1 Maltodextrin phosphorylase [Fusobacterium necrophorum subsp. necrophorum]